MNTKLLVTAILLASSTMLFAEPPTDPAALKIYNHNKQWLAGQPGPFIANNIRGEGMQYAERRQAALDLVKEKRDFAVVSELMQELEKGSFLSDQICTLLGDWKARKALPLLKKVSADASRPPEVRKQAELAAKKIVSEPKQEAPATR